MFPIYHFHSKPQSCKKGYSEKTAQWCQSLGDCREGKNAELKLLTRSRPLRETGRGHSETAKGIMKGPDP